MSSNAPIPRGPAFLSYSFNWCLATVFLLATSRGSHAVDFVRGDVNTDGRI